PHGSAVAGHGGCAATHHRLGRHPGQRRYRHIVEIAGRSDPARSGLPDQKRVVRQDAVVPRQFRYEVLMSVRRAGLAPLVLVSLLLLSGSAGIAQAQQPAAPAATPTGPSSLTIMVVDVQSLLQNSKSAKMVRQQIEEKRNEYAKDISHQEEVLRQERDSLQRQQASL